MQVLRALRSAVHPPLARVEALICRRCTGGLGAAQEGAEQGVQGGFMGQDSWSDDEDNEARAKERLVRVGIIGAPNAGKSVLTNTLVQSKVSAVSEKTNTTVRETLGVFTRGHTQVLLFDTPGVVDAKHLKTDDQRGRVRGAWTTAINCDVLLFLVDAHRQVYRPDPRIPRLLEDITPGLQEQDPDWPAREAHVPRVLLLNKVDLFERHDAKWLEQLQGQLEALHPFAATFRLSGKQRIGTEAVVEYLLDKATPHPWMLPASMTTDLSPEYVAAEVTREEVFRRLYKELPYEIEILPVKYQVGEEVIRIWQELLVKNKQHKAIAAGGGGRNINAIIQGAQETLEKTLGRFVQLKISIKVSTKNRKRSNEH